MKRRLLKGDNVSHVNNIHFEYANVTIHTHALSIHLRPLVHLSLKERGQACFGNLKCILHMYGMCIS